MELSALPVIIFFAFDLVYSWDLSSLGLINPIIKNVEVIGRRSFIAVEKFEDSPTLVEAVWPDDPKPWTPAPKAYPSDFYHGRGSCANFIEVVALDSDRLGRLWVLDKGNESCLPKVVIVNVLTGFIIRRIRVEHEDLDGENLVALVMDPEYFGVPVAYIGTDRNVLLICSSIEKKCHRRKVTLKVEENSILAELIGPDDIETSALVVNDFRNILYITTNEKAAVFSVELESLRNHSSNQPLEVEYIGDRLSPNGLILKDPTDGFIYTSSRDYAILKWDTNKPLVAEYHEVLLQSYEDVGCMTTMFEAWGQVWGTQACGENCRRQCSGDHDGDARTLTTANKDEENYST